MRKITLLLMTLTFCLNVDAQTISCGETKTVSTVGLTNTLNNYAHYFGTLNGPNTYLSIQAPSNQCNLCLSISNIVNGAFALLMLDPSDPNSTQTFPLNWIGGSFCFTPIPGQTYYLMVDGSSAAGAQLDLTLTCNPLNCPCSSNTTGEELQDSLVSYWTFDNNYQDAQGGNHGSLAGTDISFVPARHGNGIRINNAGLNNTYINVGNDPSLNMAGSSMTISAWFTIDAQNEVWQPVVCKGTGCNYRLQLWQNIDVMTWSAPGTDITGISKLADGNLHHVVGVTENNGYKALYIDGKLEAASTSGTIICDGGLDLFIGANPGHASRREWQGIIDDVAIWNRALCSKEVENIYSHNRSLGDLLKGPQIPIVSEWGLIFLALLFLSSAAALLKSSKHKPTETI